MEYKITDIEIQKNNKKRYSIYINNNFAFGISEEILFKYNLSVDKVISKEFIENIILKEEQCKANNYVLNLLSYKMYTEKEIRDKMKKKNYEIDIINKTIMFLKEYKYIDDNQYTKSFVNEKLNCKKYGKNKIKLDLYRKGINKNIIDNSLENEFDFDKEYDIALEFAIKKINSTYKNEDKNTQCRKLYNCLLSRGFSYDIISKVLKNVYKIDIIE